MFRLLLRRYTPTIGPRAFAPFKTHTIPQRHYTPSPTRERLRSIVRDQYRRIRQSQLEEQNASNIGFGGWVRFGQAPVHRMRAKNVITADDWRYYVSHTTKWERFIDSLEKEQYRNFTKAQLFVFSSLLWLAFLTVAIDWYYQPFSKETWWENMHTPEQREAVQKHIEQRLRGETDVIGALGVANRANDEVYSTTSNPFITKEQQQAREAAKQSLLKMSTPQYDTYDVKVAQSRDTYAGDIDLQKRHHELQKKHQSMVPLSQKLIVFNTQNNNTFPLSQELLALEARLERDEAALFQLSPDIALNEENVKRMEDLATIQELKDKYITELFGLDKLNMHDVRTEIRELYELEQRLLAGQHDNHNSMSPEELEHYRQEFLANNPKARKLVDPYSSPLSIMWWLEKFKLIRPHDAPTRSDHVPGRTLGRLDLDISHYQTFLSRGFSWTEWAESGFSEAYIMSLYHKNRKIYEKIHGIIPETSYLAPIAATIKPIAAQQQLADERRTAEADAAKEELFQQNIERAMRDVTLLLQAQETHLTDSVSMDHEDISEDNLDVINPVHSDVKMAHDAAMSYTPSWRDNKPPQLIHVEVPIHEPWYNAIQSPLSIPSSNTNFFGIVWSYIPFVGGSSDTTITNTNYRSENDITHNYTTALPPAVYEYDSVQRDAPHVSSTTRIAANSTDGGDDYEYYDEICITTPQTEGIVDMKAYGDDLIKKYGMNNSIHDDDDDEDDF